MKTLKKHSIYNLFTFVHIYGSVHICMYSGRINQETKGFVGILSEIVKHEFLLVISW